MFRQDLSDRPILTGGGKSVRHLTAATGSITSVPVGADAHVTGMAVDGHDNLYLSETGRGIVELSAETDTLAPEPAWSSGGHPFDGFAVDKNGNLYAAIRLS